MQHLEIDRISIFDAMGNLMATMNRPPWISPGDQMAAAAAMNGNSLVPLLQGKLIRATAGGVEWDMSKEWYGRELTQYVVRKTNWTKGYTVQFFFATVDGQPARIHEFTLWLDEKHTRDEVEQAAQTYMLALNVRRVE